MNFKEEYEMESELEVYKNLAIDYKKQIDELKEIIKNGGLPVNCIQKWDNVKFCDIRNGEGNQCLQCFF